MDENGNPVTSGRQSADWTDTLMNVLGGLGSTYLKGKYGQNDTQYVVGQDGKLYPAGVPTTIVGNTGTSTGSTMTIVVVVAVVGVLALVLLKD
ncbi:hypothetical protein HNQ50_001422 [Silvimonas terrae]|uniref:Uncharacterized protein n=1 Tax=Silvimonas terrae TaxID=300266 RepID=A0A840RE98_9NEIS|nr:hypothetical protein [Silvimonas terrae]MBB5190700.1 hypothetical protein [Silvimonas terrae]